MKHPAWSKWEALLCGSTVILYGLWQKPVGGLYWPAMPGGTQHLLRGPTINGQSVWTELSFLGQTFRSVWPFHNSLGIRSANLICQIIDYQGTCDLCCYCVLLPSSQTWIGSQEAPSFARNWKFGSLAPRASLRLKVTRIGTTMGFFLW